MFIICKLFLQNINKLYLKRFNIPNCLSSEVLKYFVCQSCGLGFFDPMETGDEKFYEQIQKESWYYMDDKEEFRIVAPWVKGSILEVGSGAAAFCKLFDKENYTGLEFNDLAIQKASENDIKLIKETVEEHAKKGKNMTQLSLSRF